ncbi:adenylosuccinate synthase [Sedimentibacter acidaminivorans]|uniref:Adenylosuccinate synthetase n=1 Tax=Sedimentibacter acidaminivorans TaxID=913099 RepID=A0ABS4GA43_9FIRM|nr:adenylosuccinate synthase [Sedimentibacter acidaminivorans]MBP1924554.1 adenylosuccinate synthase [Sedimentibacter acidaminivorans]
MLTAIVGINWGDEGKGRMVDLLSADYDVVCRYQGGNNAGHTVINDSGKFILNLLPSGVLRPEVVNVMGNGMVIDIQHLHGEIESLKKAGIKVTPENLKISDRAVICLPYHVRQDILEEERLKDLKFGSTRRGIAPVYSDKYMKKGIRMGDLKNKDALKKHLLQIVEWKNLLISGGYNSEKINPEEIWNWLMKYSSDLEEFVCDTGIYLENAIKENKRIMFEAQLGALRDIDFGIYPYTTSSSTIAAYAPVGSGIPGRKLTDTIGIMKAYSSCVGEGPFTCEMFGKEADALREAGGEYGAATGRPRRVGPFDVVASRYGTRIQGADTLALTKLDILSYLDKIPVCTGYSVNGNVTTEFPLGEDLNNATPIYEYVDGWQCDIGKCRKQSDLPIEAVNYIKYIEEKVGCPIKYISVGAEREDYLIMEK